MKTTTEKEHHKDWFGRPPAREFMNLDTLSFKKPLMVRRNYVPKLCNEHFYNVYVWWSKISRNLKYHFVVRGYSNAFDICECKETRKKPRHIDNKYTLLQSRARCKYHYQFLASVVCIFSFHTQRISSPLYLGFISTH